ncbi:MAG: hypothetical protein V4477_16920 [Pseudomonadota bacterium]
MRDCSADRLSVHEGDPGYSQYVRLGGHGARIKIFLDGAEQRGCVTADRTQGWIRRFKESNGQLVVDGDRVAEEVVYGKVEFKIEEAA